MKEYKIVENVGEMVGETIENIIISCDETICIITKSGKVLRAEARCGYEEMPELLVGTELTVSEEVELGIITEAEAKVKYELESILFEKKRIERERAEYERLKEKYSNETKL